jgi:hypothetical protein
MNFYKTNSTISALKLQFFLIDIVSGIKNNLEKLSDVIKQNFINSHKK